MQSQKRRRSVGAVDSAVGFGEGFGDVVAHDIIEGHGRRIGFQCNGDAVFAGYSRERWKSRGPWRC